MLTRIPQDAHDASYGSFVYMSLKLRQYHFNSGITRQAMLEPAGLSPKQFQRLFGIDEADRMKLYAEPPTNANPTLHPRTLERIAGIFKMSFESLARETGVRTSWGMIRPLSLMGKIHTFGDESTWSYTNMVSNRVSWAVAYYMDLKKETIHVRSIRSRDVIFVDLVAPLKDECMYVIKLDERGPLFAWYTEGSAASFRFYPPTARGKKTPKEVLAEEVQVFGEVVEIIRDVRVPTFDSSDEDLDSDSRANEALCGTAP